jgi:AcrR family transcriptional regulator
MPRRTAPPPKQPRRRRDAESARAAILDAAEQRLVSAGPGGIRLQDVAKDVGVSHPTVLHHFGSREALVKAVVERAVAGIHERLIQVSAAAQTDEGQIASMIEGVFEALQTRGYGRVILWLALEGQMIEATPVPLKNVVDALHATLSARAHGKSEQPSRETIAHSIILGALTLLASTVLGPTLLEHSGMQHDAAAQKRFRSWLAQLLASQLRNVE